MNKFIDKVIQHYKYNNEISNYSCKKDFARKYNNFTDKDTLKNWSHTIFSVLNFNPNSTHIAAKNLLYQGDERCWLYFERTALFWTKSHINDPYIDHIRDEFQYSLYVQREDLIKILFDKSEEYLSRDDYKNNKDFINQKVYPSTQLLHFLLEKWLGYNPIKQKILNYGEGYGIYQNIIDNWNDLSIVEPNYWDELCDYHLNGLSLELREQDKYYREEFLGCGLVPMELINLIKVRKKLNLDIPKITHELFQTPFAQEPIIPTGYNENFDVVYQMVKKTVEMRKRFTIEEIINELEQMQGKSMSLFIW